jgi:hypothetical protein
MAVGENNLIIGKCSFGEGANNIIGCLTFQIISGDIEAKTITLDANLNDFKDRFDSYISDTSKSSIAYKLETNYYNSKIVAVDYETNTLSLDMLVTPSNSYDGYDEATKTFNVKDYNSVKYNGNYQPNKLDTCYKIWFTNADLSGYFIGDLPGVNIGKYTHAEGYGNVSYADMAHTEGCYNVAIGRYAHSEGFNTQSGYAAHSEGRYTKATGEHSHAEGYGTNAYANQSHAAGCFCTVLSDDLGSYVWNGVARPNKKIHYYSHGVGTFNINPKNGLSGVYIGDKSLNNIIDEKIIGVDEEKLSTLVKDVVEDMIDNNTLISDISDIKSNLDILSTDIKYNNDTFNEKIGTLSNEHKTDVTNIKSDLNII